MEAKVTRSRSSSFFLLFRVSSKETTFWGLATMTAPEEVLEWLTWKTFGEKQCYVAKTPDF